MRMSRRLFAAMSLLTAAVPASSALADPVVTGQWYEFSFPDGPGGAAAACVSCVPSSGGNSIFAPSPAWTINLAGPGTFTLTDAFLNVNSFSLFDFGGLVGSTPAASGVGTCGDDPVPCLADPQSSHAVFALGAGAHSFTIVNNEGQGGAAYFRIDATTTAPEPSTVVLLAGGLAGLAAAARRRRSA